MFKINENYLKLPGSYLFSTIAKKVNAYQEANPEKDLIRLGIGDVTQPLAPSIIERQAQLQRKQNPGAFRRGRCG
jgi:LL-diaminopimelate aminotransferase